MELRTLIVLLGLTMTMPVHGASAGAGESSDILRKMEEVNAQYAELLDKMDGIERQRRQLELLLYQIDDLDQYRGGMDTSDATPEAVEVATERKEELEAQTQAMPDLPSQQ